MLLPGRLLRRGRPLAGRPDAWRSSRARPSTTSRSAAAAPASTCGCCRPRTSRSCPQPQEEPGLKIPAAALEESIELVARAASRDDMRPVLTGVFVSASGKEMTMVATDSYRLAVKRTELESELGGELEANIPARALRELGRILSSEGAERGDDLAAPQPGRFRGRGDPPHDEADRRPVPQLSTAPAGVLRARRAAAALGLPRRHPPGQPAGAAQRAAAALLRVRAS